MKNFSDFNSITLNFGNPEQDFNFGYTAIPSFECKEDENFENDYFLLFRRSEYASQVELACAKIYKYILGYGPEMEILKEGENFYIASRRIKGFGRQLNLTEGLISIVVISYFIAQTDTHSGNYGCSTISEKTFFYGIDNAEALNFEALSKPLDLTSLRRLPYLVEKNFIGFNAYILPSDYVKSKVFQQEKIDIIRRIASIPFAVFESILQETITSNFAIHQREMLKRLQKLGLMDETTPSPIFDEDKYSLSELIQLFRKRHESWCQLALDLKDDEFSQDDSFADVRLFLQESNKFHEDVESSDEESDSVSLDNRVSFFQQNVTEIAENDTTSLRLD